MSKDPSSAAATLLIRSIDEAFDHKSWHGTTLLGSLRGVTAAAAAWRPAPRRHNIWELAVHAAYWKHAVRRRLTGEKRGTFALKGHNWFVRPAAEAEWKDDVRMLVEEHRRLREVVARMTPASLLRTAQRGRPTAEYLIRGAAAHDLYHAGQIQLLKRLRAG